MYLDVWLNYRVVVKGALFILDIHFALRATIFLKPGKCLSMCNSSIFMLGYLGKVPYTSYTEKYILYNCNIDQ